MPLERDAPRGPYAGWGSADFTALVDAKTALMEVLLRYPARVRWRALYESTITLWPADESPTWAPRGPTREGKL